MLEPLYVRPQAKERVWGGTRLLPPRSLPIGELWLAGPWVEVAAGEHAGRTLDELAADLGEPFVGSAAITPAQAGDGGEPAEIRPRFPLLVKLLDAADWLSVQVHPDDAVARELEGPGAVGKTEAWYVVDADAGAELLCGVLPGTTIEQARDAIAQPPDERGSAVVDLMARVAARPGDAILVRAGTLHAVGPGLLLYELQQPSDLTYRVDDWGRPPSGARPLHQAQALASVAVGPVTMLPAGLPRSRRPLLACEHFALDLLEEPAALDPGGRTCHVVTAVDGSAALEGRGWTAELHDRATVVVPAAAGPYRATPAPGARALVARLP